MSKGFQQDSDLRIQAALKRLLPSAKRGDIHAFADGVRRMAERYGHDIADEAMRLVLVDYPSLTTACFDFLPKEKRDLGYGIALEIMADVISDGGLRLEDHFRVSDEGIAITEDAAKVIAATDFPEKIPSNKSLVGMGLSRDPFVHPLSDVFNVEDYEGKYLNMYAFASLIISSACGWIPDANSEAARSNLATIMFKVSPKQT